MGDEECFEIQKVIMNIGKKGGHLRAIVIEIWRQEQFWIIPPVAGVGQENTALLKV